MLVQAYIVGALITDYWAFHNRHRLLGHQASPYQIARRDLQTQPRHARVGAVTGKVRNMEMPDLARGWARIGVVWHAVAATAVGSAVGRLRGALLVGCFLQRKGRCNEVMSRHVYVLSRVGDVYVG